MIRSALSTSRASQLRLTSKLDLATRAGALLHNKEEALQRERVRLEGHADRTQQRWIDQCQTASNWLLRSSALGATGEISSAVQQMQPQASITIAWQHSMGLNYPGRVECTPAMAINLSSTAAIVPAAKAYQQALIAGADHAAAAAAVQRLDDELSNTRRRRRAIERRLQPRLEEQLHALGLDLDEREREAAIRTQIAKRQRTPQS